MAAGGHAPEFSGVLLATSGPYTERMFQTGPAGGLIGRSRKCKISLLHDCEVSHNHAIIELQDGALCIRDVGSTFGTYLNEKRLSEPKRASDSHKLKPCDSIKVGQTSLRWWPISSIRCAASVTIPHVLASPSEYLSRVSAALLPADDHVALSRVLNVQHVQVARFECSLRRPKQNSLLHPANLPVQCCRLAHPSTLPVPCIHATIHPIPRGLTLFHSRAHTRNPMHPASVPQCLGRDLSSDHSSQPAPTHASVRTDASCEGEEETVRLPSLLEFRTPSP